MAKQRAPGGTSNPRTLKWSAIFVLVVGCGIVGLSMYTENLWMYELSSALMMIGTPIAVLGLVLLWLEWSLAVNARVEGNWDHHDKPTLKTRFNQGAAGLAGRFMPSRFGDDSMFEARHPVPLQTPAAPVAMPVTAPAAAFEAPAPVAAQPAPAAEEPTPAELTERSTSTAPVVASTPTAPVQAPAQTHPALLAFALAADSRPAPAGHVDPVAPPMAEAAVVADDRAVLSGPMAETQVIETPLAQPPAPEPAPAAAAATSRVIAFRRKDDRRPDEAAAHGGQSVQDKTPTPLEAWADTIIDEHGLQEHSLTSGIHEAPSQRSGAAIAASSKPVPRPTVLAQAIDSALARIHGRKGAQNGPAVQPAVEASGADKGQAFADTQPFDFDAHQLESDSWNATRLNQLDQTQFVSLVEAFYQQAGFVTQQQPSDRPHGPVLLWLYSQQRPGQPVSVVRCVHAPGMPLAPIELVSVGQMVQSRGLSRGQLATTCIITAPARALAMVHNINLLDTPAMLDLIAQRSPEQQELLAARSA